MTLGRRLPRATALAAMGLLLTLGACGDGDGPDVDTPDVVDVDVPEVPDVDVPAVAETVTFACASPTCDKTKEAHADAAPS